MSAMQINCSCSSIFHVHFSLLHTRHVFAVTSYLHWTRQSIASHLNFVSVRYKWNESAVYCQGFVAQRCAASSVDGITDYNIYCILRAAPLASGVDTM